MKISRSSIRSLNGSRLHTVEQSALNEGVSFLLALSVNAVVAIDEPIKKGKSTIVWIMFRQSLYALRIQSISRALLAVWSLKFEVVSDTNQLNAVFSPLPILPHYTKNHDPIAEVVIFVDVDQNRPVLSVCNI